jgi:hypothetical protein
MTTVWVAGILGLFMLCLGTLVGSSWTVQGLDRQYRRLAVQRKELNKSRRTLQENTLPLARCVWCDNLIAPSAGDYEDGAHVAKLGGQHLAERELRANLPGEQEVIARDISRLELAPSAS